jgi:hypothetical protein
MSTDSKTLENERRRSMNKDYGFLWRFGLLVCVLLLGVNCSTTMKLRYEKPPFEEMSKGRVYVVVNDKRLPDRGGTDPTRVGTIRNNLGMPFPLNSSEDREPTKVINELISDCLKAAGYSVVERPDDVPLMDVTLQSFWSDGYQHSRMWTEIPTELKRDKDSSPVWRCTFQSNMGITWMAPGYGPFDDGFSKMLEDVKQQMIFQFKDPKFSDSMNSL